LNVIPTNHKTVDILPKKIKQNPTVLFTFRSAENTQFQKPATAQLRETLPEIAKKRNRKQYEATKIRQFYFANSLFRNRSGSVKIVYQRIFARRQLFHFYSRTIFCKL
jgi:hypothetical protein